MNMTPWRLARRLGLYLLLSLPLTTALASPTGEARRLWPTAASTPQALAGETIRRVNAPYFPAEIRMPETAVFWFGRVTPSENSIDGRVGYNPQELYLRLAIFDRRLWYGKDPAPQSFAQWDAVTLYLDPAGSGGDGPSVGALQLRATLNWWEDRAAYQAAFRWDGQSWQPAALDFQTTSGWRGDAPNNDNDDRGWVLTFHLPFASLGLTAPPPQGTLWRMALAVHDRDDAQGTPIQDKRWPEGMLPEQPATWGQLRFGLPSYTPPTSQVVERVTLRHKLDGLTVPDADVGGSTVCGDGMDFFAEWGEANYAGSGHFNIQNQADVADWPCYSKYFVTFPLDRLPAGRSVVSARLVLHQFGNSEPSQAQPSWIQVLTVAEDWQEQTLTWNSAPLAAENIGGAWVDPLTSFPGWPGMPYQWDVSYAVAQAYQASQPLRLALYSADAAYHSGKYFVSSDTGDWNAEGRPTLIVELGPPVSSSSFQDVPPDHPYFLYIEALYEAGYVKGCSLQPPLYCPERALNRAESAVFTVRGVHGTEFTPPQPTLPPFDDVPLEAWYVEWVDQLKQDGYTAGCSADPPLYCPERIHTRAEGAVFFLRMMYGADYQPPPGQGYFADVDPDAWYADWVDAAWEAGIAEPCGENPLRYCPEDPLTRAVAAYMMAQAKGVAP